MTVTTRKYWSPSKQCIDCSIFITDRAKRCKSCSATKSLYGRTLSKSHRENISIGLGKREFVKGHKQSEISRKKISDSLKNQYLTGKRNVNGGYIKPVKYKGIMFRSGWEISLAKWLDSRKIKWIYEPKRYKISIGTYLPDFFIPSKNLYIEVKGKMVGIEKMQCFAREYGVKVILADKSYFIKKGISLN